MPVKLITAPHTPFDQHGDLNLPVVQRQAEHFCATGVAGVFVGGSTGEGASLSVAEREQLAACWAIAGQEAGLDVIIHVGHNCQRDAVRLAAHACEVGADAISSFAPSYFKPTTVDDLIDFFVPIASAADSLPFFFYDIPALTGVSLSTIEFLHRAEDRLPSLAGVKYTNTDLAQFRECLRFDDSRYEIWFGCDEALLAGYALGARGAVGSTYNFAAPLYHRMITAYEEGDEHTARDLQAQSVALIHACQSFGYSAAAKAVMSLIGIDCGPVRSPLRSLSGEQIDQLRRKLEQLNVLDLARQAVA